MVEVNIRNAPYSARGNGVANDTQSIQQALDDVHGAGGGSVCVPNGCFIASGLVGYPNVALRGWGENSALKQPMGVTDNNYLYSCFGTGSDPTTNPRGLRIADLRLIGRCDTDPFTQHVHLLAFSGVSDVTVERVRFDAWRGDAIYFASSLSNGQGIERHNERVHIDDCDFDGLNFNNRNAISVIDGTDLHVTGSDFTNCSAPGMPGAIDLEPNGAPYARVRSIRIDGNTFDGVGGDVGSVCFDCDVPQDSLITPSRSIWITNNTIRNSRNTNAGIFLRHRQAPTDTTPRNDFMVRGNSIEDNLSNPIGLEGMRGVRIEGNYLGRSALAALAVGYEFRCKDIHLAGNDLVNSGTDEGSAIGVYSVDRLRVERNVLDAIGDGAGTGRLVSFNAGSGGASSSTAVDFIENRVVGFASAPSAKAAGHTLNAQTNAWARNDTTLVANPAHFAKAGL